MVRRTKEAALGTREQILDAAEHVFFERGVAHTALADIAQAAGCTRGAIYWHFKDKAELVNAMLERALLPVEAIAETRAEAPSSEPLAQARTRAVAVLRRAALDAQCRRVFSVLAHKCEYVEEMGATRERLLAGRSTCWAKLENNIRAAIRHGQLPRTLDPAQAARALQAYIDGLIHNWLLDPTAFSLADEAEALVDLFIQGLLKRNSSEFKP